MTTKNPMHSSILMGEEVASLTKAIKAVGDEIRMKKASGEDIGLLVDKLKDLKAKFQGVTGKPFDPPKEKEKKKKKEKQPEHAPAASPSSSSSPSPLEGQTACPSPPGTWPSGL